MRFCSLGSGSSGNATLVEARSEGRITRLLVDCGLTLRELSHRLARHGLTPADLSAVFVTHEHADHIGCATALMRRYRLPVWMSEGSWQAATRGAPPRPTLHFARADEPIAIGALELRPFAVPHDSAEPLQLVCSDGGTRLGIVTDLGHGPSSVIERLRGCHALLLECNHDTSMLASGPYPYFLKRRVGGPFGHLANLQAAEILQGCRDGALRHVVAAHLSLQNNRPELAALALTAVLGARAEDIVIADAELGTPWLDLH